MLVVLLARSITTFEFGMYSSIINILSLLLIITNFGFSEFILVNSNTLEKLKDNSSKLIQYSASLAVSLIIIGGLFYIEYFFLFVLLGLKIFIEGTFMQVLLSVYQVRNDINKIAYINILVSILTTLAIIISYILKFDIYGIIISATLVNLIFVALNFRYIKPKFKLFYFNQSVIISSFKELKYYGVSMITVPFYMFTPGFVGAIILSKTDLSIYQVAFSISSLLIVVLTSYIQTVLPRFISISNEKNIRKFKELLNSTILRVLIFNILVLITFYFSGKYLLNLVYNDSFYVQSYPYLLILISANMLQAIAGVLGIFFTVNKLQREKYNIQIEFIILSWILSLTLTHFFSILGLACSFIILYGYVLFRYYIFYRSRINNIYK